MEDIKTGTELVRWYWLKEELVAYCKLAGINYKGVKFDILKRALPVEFHQYERLDLELK